MRHKSFIRLLNCIWALRFRGCQRNNLLIIEGPLFSGHTGFAAHKIFGHFFSSSKLLHNIKLKKAIYTQDYCQLEKKCI